MTWHGRPPEYERSSEDPRQIGDGLDRIAHRLGAPAASAMGAVFSRWEAAVGSAIAAHARPVGLHDGVLTVAVDDPAWATQLRFLANDIVGKIAAVAGPNVVGRIEVRVEPSRG